MDYQLFKMINNTAGKNEVIDSIMIFLSSYMLFVFLGSFFIFLFIKKTRKMSIIGLVSMIISLGISQIISFIYYKNRPFVDYDVNLLIEKGISSSFPSDQAVIVFTCSIAVWYYKKSAGVALFIFALLVALSRIYVGHHYPFDVMASLLIALLSGTVTTKLFYWVTSRGKTNTLTQ
ncbi:undecaprenyl-diphosphatase [Bacillus sp. Marseille-P3661]|uniref:undecaprenyl-diphosphatase n=1 Tax=Bacillus sp. Marseille-P3661 TaxID=1936234 RepID=UPI000C838F44|nr:undecaprenyl-diphosphatase [Bacillus sp. Marseille-P3661]